jgi:hypothetical protein
MVCDEAQRYRRALVSDLPLNQIESLVRRHFADIDKIAIATPRPAATSTKCDG